MSGIDRLRTLAGEWDAYGLGGTLEDVARQIERERDELRTRLMPEGMEWLVEAWPKFEDDAPLKLGDMALVDGDADMVEAIQLWIHGKPVIYGDNSSQQLEKGERVRRPAPKVLDADGAEAELGDDLYSVEGGLKFHVSHVDRANGKIATDAMFAIDKWADPKMYTHRAPVLAADGEPLEVGQTVWRDDGEMLEVLYLRPDGLVDCCGEIERPERLTHQRPVLDADGVPIKVGDTVWMVDDPDGPYRVTKVTTKYATHVHGYSDEFGDLDMSPSQLTHERPETRQSIVDEIGEEMAKRIDAIVSAGRWN